MRTTPTVLDMHLLSIQINSKLRNHDHTAGRSRVKVSTMTDANVVLVPARFVVTLGHILALSMAKGSLNDNIRASLDPRFGPGHNRLVLRSHFLLEITGTNPTLFLRSDYSSLHEESYPYPHPTELGQPYYEQYQSLLQSATSAINAGYVCLVLDMFGLLSGLTIFMKRINLLQTTLHFCGSALTCWYVCEYLFYLSC